MTLARDVTIKRRDNPDPQTSQWEPYVWLFAVEGDEEDGVLREVNQNYLHLAVAWYILNGDGSGGWLA